MLEYFVRCKLQFIKGLETCCSQIFIRVMAYFCILGGQMVRPGQRPGGLEQVLE